MLSKAFPLTALCSMLFIANPVYANWQSSSISVNFFWLVIIPFLLIHLIASLVLNLKGDYKSKKVGLIHFQIAMLFPLMGIVILMYEFFEDMPYTYYNANDFGLGLGVYALLMLIAALPYVMSIAKSK